ncbi:MAG TPA: hypothetical protein PKO30_12465 [Prolixibacteraceae bacterium]|nr:hypothetical protein [Prolixibacteraceae bacterium]
MKKILNVVCLLFILIFALTSCEYSPSEIPLTEIQEPKEPPSISINLTPEVDTIKLSTTVYVTYSVNTGSHAIYDLKFFMDDVDMGNPFTGIQGSYSTTIQASKLTDGLHILKIRTNTATNSGSIADKVGAEQYVYELKWPVLVNKEAKNQVKFTSLQVVPEGIKLSWYKYDYADFQRYTVGRSSLILGYSKELVNTTDPYLTTFVDNTYIEGDYVTYSLMAYMDGFAMDSRSFVEEIKNPKVTVKPDRTVDVIWNPSKYPRNVKSCFLKTSVPTFGYPEEHEVSDLAQTTIPFSTKIGFGGNYGMQLRYIPKGYDGYYTYDVKGGLTNFALGDSIPSFERGFLIYGTNSLLLYNNGKFSKYNYSTGQISNSFSITPIEKVYQRFMLSSISGSLFGYFQNQEFFVRRSNDWSLLNKMDIGSMDRFNPNWNVISISDDGKVAAIDIYNNLQIYDFKTGAKISGPKFESPLVPMQANFSPDGKTLSIRLTNYMEQKSLLVAYSFGPNGLDKVNELALSNSSYEATFSYSPVDGKIIYLNYGGMYNYSVDIINPQTFVVENSVKIPDFFIPVAYDYENSRVVAQYQFFPTQEYSYLLDVKTGKQSKIVQFVGQEQFLFSNGTVYSGNGRSIKIDDYILQ